MGGMKELEILIDEFVEKVLPGETWIASILRDALRNTILEWFDILFKKGFVQPGGKDGE